MRRIDDGGDAFRLEIVFQPGRPAEAADAHWHRLRRRIFRAPGQRKGDAEIGAGREAGRERTGIAGAAEEEDVGFHG
ncbi:hypothetical protein XFLAVUS301_26580 [Xanthobacter flavus]|uniref:Uncharacterized protein n=1 Tax=Xanthobacter flavus TaxID=281 RepID=A0A9W6CLM3_XANFL|nr:hypothetical protein XFLAVUS301_26580 [Xanthobacter flavus]